MSVRLVPSKRQLDWFVAALTIVGGLSAAVWALFEYYSNDHAAAVTKTLAFYERTISRQSEISDSLNEVGKTLEATRSERVNAAREARNDLNHWINYNISFVNSHDRLRYALIKVVDYFEALYYCVKSKACDEDAAVGLFGSMALSYRTNFFPWLYCQKQYQKTGIPFGRAVNFFAIEFVSFGAASDDRDRIKAHMESDQVTCPKDWQSLGRGSGTTD